jgi:protein-tyrosine phosphatase
MENEWTYKQRWEMQKIVARLYLGPYTAAKNYQTLKTNNITDILIVKSPQEPFIKPYFPNDFNYKILEIDNSQFTNLIGIFEESFVYIKKVLENGSLLVHCMGGISRAPSIVIAYLIDCGFSFEAAFNNVRNKRFCINPLESFIIQLEVLYCLMRVMRVL